MSDEPRLTPAEQPLDPETREGLDELHVRISPTVGTGPWFGRDLHDAVVLLDDLHRRLARRGTMPHGCAVARYLTDAHLWDPFDARRVGLIWQTVVSLRAWDAMRANALMEAIRSSPKEPPPLGSDGDETAAVPEGIPAVSPPAGVPARLRSILNGHAS